MNPIKKVLISLFIVLNLLAMFRILMPFQNRFIRGLYRPVDTYLAFFSIYQDWMMFAPDPSKDDHFVTALIEFKDGTSTSYEFEHQLGPDTLQKYLFGERFRKITSESIHKDENRFMWKDSARFALRKVKDRHLNQIPMKVHLFRHWSTTPLLTKELIPHRYLKTNYSSYRFYTYEVTAQTLKSGVKAECPDRFK